MPLTQTEQPPAAPAPRRPARDIIDAVVENMRKNREPLKYSTIAPSRYTVYLHPAEFARLQDIILILHEETIRALADELEAMNRRSRVQRWVDRFTGQHSLDIRNPGGEWQIEFVADPDGELAEGDVLVDSQLILPTRPELGAGERTRRITTVHRGQQTSVTEQQTMAKEPAPPPHPEPTVARSVPPPQPEPAVFARITYDDDSGSHAYDVTKDSLTLGRGGVAYPVDVRIVSSPDVSREHARIHRDPQTGRFFLVDLSSLGTTLNGRHVPRGYDDVEGTKRENGTVTALPDVARIGLADTVFLEFRKVR